MGFDSQDFVTKNSYPEYLGHYHFKGLQDSMPYYEKMLEKGINSVSPNKGSSPSSKLTSPTRSMFLFFNPKDEMWVFGPTLGDATTAEFGSSRKNLAQCPGDPQATVI